MKTVHLVAQTHWDREWYFTKEDSNILLHNEIFKILETYKENPKFTYTLDGQTVLIEEFCKKYPNTNIKDLISQKKLFIGPWYTQTDTLLVSKESIISNLYYGIKQATEYGNSMNIGYIPDAFGQSNYMPSIFKNVGLDYAMFQRGLYTEQHPGFVNFNWKSPDGNTIKTHNMLQGYAVFGNYELTDEFIEKRAIPTLKELEQFNCSEDHLMIPCGWDQTSIDGNFEDFVGFLNKKVPQYKFISSSYENFVEQLNFENQLNSLKDLRGTERSRLHRTIGSSRYDIKLLADKVDHMLLSQLQPLAIIYHTFSVYSLQPQIDAIWKELFDCQAHDSIGCCNSDETNSSILERLKACLRQIDSLLNLIKKTIALSIDRPDEREIIILFNSDINKASNYEVTLYGRKPRPIITTLEKKTIEYNIREIEAVKAGTKLEMIDGVQCEIPEDDFYKITLDLEYPVSSIGYEVLYVEFDSIEHCQKTNLTKIENETMQIKVENGELLVFDKKNKQEFQIRILDDVDNGDTYDFDYVAGSLISNEPFEVISCQTNGYLQTMHVQTKLLPSENRKSILEYPVDMYFELGKSSDIKHKIIINNVNDNHRVRLQYKFKNEIKVLSGNGYSRQQLENDTEHLENWLEKGYAERPTNVFNFEKLFAIETENMEYQVQVQGCKEIEFSNSNCNLTLFRSVGTLGKANLNNRPGRASGINNKIISTPESQLRKELEFEIMLVPSKDNILHKHIYKKTNSYHLQSLDYFDNRIDRFYLSGFENFLPNSISLIKFSKKYNCSMIRDNQKYIYARLYNPGESSLYLDENTLKFQQVNLLDEPIENQTYIPRHGYITVRIGKEKDDN